MNSFYFVRHGETDYNKLNLVQGQQDFHLNQKGRDEAKYIANKIRNLNFDLIYCSTLLRAKETASIIKKEAGFNIDIQYDKRLIERNFGEAEGKKVSEVFTYFSNKTTHTIKGYESDSEVYNRVYSFIKEINSNIDNKNILVVTHSNSILCLLINISEEYKIDYKIKNCSLTKIDVDKYNNLKIDFANKII